MESDRKAIWGWALYDWANSAFATTVMAGFFPIFFKQFWSAGADVNVSTAQLGFGNSISSLMVAIMAPILGAIADKGSTKKKFLVFFAYLGVLMTAALFLVQEGQWHGLSRRRLAVSDQCAHDVDAAKIRVARRRSRRSGIISVCGAVVGPVYLFYHILGAGKKGCLGR
jgi:MFS-type transporter involved in bile tolerance (Atg22 family)